MSGDSEAPKVRIYVMGREYKVPAGLTIMKAIEYAGYRFIRGSGCRGGFCGACATVYRIKGDYKLRTALACQKVVEDGMYLVQLPFVPAEKAKYNLEKLTPSVNVLLEHYPEIAKCVSCNIVPYRVALLARRLYGKYVLPRAKHVDERVKEIEEHKFDEEIKKLIETETSVLKKIYEKREIEPE